jgi:hypothetical protein
MEKGPKTYEGKMDEHGQILLQLATTIESHTIGDGFFP